MRYAKLVLVTFALLVTSKGYLFAEGSTEARVLNTFGNWRIEIEKTNRSLHLIGVVTEGQAGFFSVACYASTNWHAIMVPFFHDGERDAARKRGFAMISSWNERGDPVELRMYSKEAMGAISLAKPENANSSNLFDRSGSAFLLKLEESKSFFAIELGGPSRTYDAKHLPAALARFKMLCSRARTDWLSLLQ